MGFRAGRIAYRLARHAAYVAATIPRLMGMHPRHCNVCGYHGRFMAFGQPPRFDAHCPDCGSLERHRLLKLWIDENAERVSQSDLLHFAPEPELGQQLSKLARSYDSADLAERRARRILNIEAIDLPPASHDIVVCSHVLEHVDDRKAMREIHRILRPGGIALLMTPVVEGWDDTYEDEAATSAAKRSLYFGQSDHVRFYGSDIRLRLADAGFVVEEFTAREPYVSHHSLIRGDKIFVCHKSQVAEGFATTSHPANQKAELSLVAGRRSASPLPVASFLRHRGIR